MAIDAIVTAGVGSLLAVTFIAAVSLLGATGINYINSQSTSNMLSQALEAKAGERALNSLDDQDDNNNS